MVHESISVSNYTELRKRVSERIIVQLDEALDNVIITKPRIGDTIELTFKFDLIKAEGDKK